MVWVNESCCTLLDVQIRIIPVISDTICKTISHKWAKTSKIITAHPVYFCLEISVQLSSARLSCSCDLTSVTIRILRASVTAPPALQQFAPHICGQHDGIGLQLLPTGSALLSNALLLNNGHKTIVSPPPIPGNLQADSPTSTCNRLPAALWKARKRELGSSCLVQKLLWPATWALGRQEAQLGATALQNGKFQNACPRTRDALRRDMKTFFVWLKCVG